MLGNFLSLGIGLDNIDFLPVWFNLDAVFPVMVQSVLMI